MNLQILAKNKVIANFSGFTVMAVFRCCSLKELSIVKCDRLSDKTISDILQHCTMIENLTLVGSLSLGYVTQNTCGTVTRLNV